MDYSQRTKQINQTLILVLILNWIVAIAKIIFGLFIKSNSMTADGYHSFSDGTSNILGLVGIWIASKPVDKKHPYGHKKYETFYSLTIAILLILICANIIHSGIERFRNPVIPQVNIYSFIIMIITMVVNIIVMNYEYKVGKNLNSDVLISDSMHTRADILTSLSVIIALWAVIIGYPIVDIVGSFFITIFIGYAAIDIIKHSSDILCDTAVIDTKEIEKVIKQIEGVKACHKIRTRGRYDDIFIDLHILVKDDMHMDKAHELSYRIEDAIKKHFPGISDVIVHLEPITSQEKQYSADKKKLSRNNK